MALWLLALLLLFAATIVLRPALRRAFGTGGSHAEHPAVRAGAVPVDAPDANRAPPAAPPDTPSEPGEARLAPAQVFTQLRAVQLGRVAQTPAPGQLEPELAAARAAIGDPASERRHFPRRPNLLPQLMHAIHDETVARRQLVGIIAGDPALVDNLLRMANSPFYRLGPQPVESIERAVAVLGSDGLRSVIATALLQPIYNAATARDFPRFAQLVWEHALRSAQAAMVHAAIAERADPFTAELLSLISGLAEIVLFRATREHCAALKRTVAATATVIGALMDTQAGALAQRIGVDWQLSEPARAALAEQGDAPQPNTALGRSLRFGRLVGALAVLHAVGELDTASVRQSMPSSTLPVTHQEALLAKLLQPVQDPRTGGACASAQRH